MKYFWLQRKKITMKFKEHLKDNWCKAGDDFVYYCILALICIISRDGLKAVLDWKQLLEGVSTVFYIFMAIMLATSVAQYYEVPCMYHKVVKKLNRLLGVKDE